MDPEDPEVPEYVPERGPGLVVIVQRTKDGMLQAETRFARHTLSDHQCNLEADALVRWAKHLGYKVVGHWEEGE